MAAASPEYVYSVAFEQVLMKMDIEQAEYKLVSALCGARLARRRCCQVPALVGGGALCNAVDLASIEWHGSADTAKWAEELKVGRPHPPCLDGAGRRSPAAAQSSLL